MSNVAPETQEKLVSADGNGEMRTNNPQRTQLGGSHDSTPFAFLRLGS
jgi:hypothetical protein